MEIRNFTITKRDGSKSRFALDKIMNAVVKAYESVEEPADLGTISRVLGHLHIEDDMSVEAIQDEVESALMRETHHDRRHDNPGRPVTTCLCPGLPDSRVASLLVDVGKKLKESIDKPLQLIVSYFLALFSLMKTVSHYGKVKHYWRLLRQYVKSFKIPALRTIQDAIRHFLDWKKSPKNFISSACIRLKFRAMEMLQGMIEDLLPKLEPALMPSKVF